MKKLTDRLGKLLREDKRWVSLVIFGAALAVRLIYIASLSGSVYWDLFNTDSYAYYLQGRAMADGVPVAPEGFFMTPLYPVFLALFNLLGLGLFSGPG